MEDECTMHVLKCQDPRAKEQWTKLLEKLEKWMKQSDTSPPLQRGILTGLKRWNESTPSPGPWTGEGLRSLREALESQEHIGWDNFVRGRVSKKMEAFMS